MLSMDVEADEGQRTYAYSYPFPFLPLYRLGRFGTCVSLLANV